MAACITELALILILLPSLPSIVFLGANWDAVGSYVDMSSSLKDFDLPVDPKGLEGAVSRSSDVKSARGVAKALWGAIVGWPQRLLARRAATAAVAAAAAAEKSSKGLKESIPSDSLPPGSEEFGFGERPGGGQGRAHPQDGDALSEADSHDAWSDVSARELAHELLDECPFLPDRSASYADVLRRTESSGGGLGQTSPSRGTREPDEVDVELGLGAGAGAGGGGTPPAGAESGSPTSPAIEVGVSMRRGRGSSSSLAPIHEGKPAVTVDAAGEEEQECVTSATGAKLLNELRRALTSEKISSEELPDYYASVPGPVGAQMQQQLAAELAQQHDGAAAGQPMVAAAAPQEPTPMYYSSLPTNAGRKLQEELRLALQRGESAESPSGAPGPASPPAVPATPIQPAAAAPAESSDDPSRPQYYSSLPASARQSLQQELQRHLAASGPAGGQAAGARPPLPPLPPVPQQAPQSTQRAMSSTTSMPANVGRALQAQLQQRLQKSASTVSSRSGSKPRSPRAASSQRSLLERISPGPVQDSDWDAYHTTVSGVLGSNLAAEVQHQLRHPPPVFRREELARDLLGRKLARTSATSTTPSAQDASTKPPTAAQRPPRGVHFKSLSLSQ